MKYFSALYLKLIKPFICVILLFSLAGCSAPAPVNAALEFTDSAGNTLRLNNKPERVVALSSSLADLWLAAGGKLAGVTDDIADRNLEYDLSNIAIVGALMKPGAESILALKPDLVLYSPDIPAHKELVPVLTQAGVPCGAISVDTFSEYLTMFKLCCSLTGHDELYAEYGEKQQEEIEKLLFSVPKGEPQSILFLRAFSSGVKALASEHVVCDILEKINTVNIASSESGLLEELSLEAIVKEDPDFILIITMGADQGKAMASLETALSGNPAWSSLSAVKNGRCVVLPKDLYQYKPNRQWSNAYEYLLQTLYPDVYGTAS